MFREHIINKCSPLKIVQTCFMAHIWYFLVNVPCTLGKNMYSEFASCTCSVNIGCFKLVSSTVQMNNLAAFLSTCPINYWEWNIKMTNNYRISYLPLQFCQILPILDFHYQEHILVKFFIFFMNLLFVIIKLFLLSGQILFL